MQSVLVAALLPCWILAAFIISIPSVSSLDVCYNQWSIGPSEASSRNCNILGGSTDLVSRCGVTRGNENVTIEWHFSSSLEEAGKKGNILGSSMDQHVSVNMICLDSVCVAELTIYNVSISDAGYYWCKVAPPAGASMDNIRNPSSVLNINGSCEKLYPCTESSIETRSLNSNLGCAYGEVTANSSQIVHLQGDSECGGYVIATSNDIEEATTAITSDRSTAAITSDRPTAAITSDSPTSALLPNRPTNQTMTKPTNTQQTSDGPASTDMTTSDQIFLTTRQTGPPPDGNTTPDITSNAMTPAAASEGVSGDGDGTSDTTSGEDSTGELPHVVWAIIGVGIFTLLLIIAILLGLVVCLQCRKRKTKDNNVACVNQGYMVEEIELIHTRSTDLMMEKDHLYAEIPSNFTLTASSNEHSPSLPASHSVSAKIIHCSGQYEDIDLEPTKQNNATSRKHQYETVTNDDYNEYNSLLHSQSWSHNRSLSTSLPRTSGSQLLNGADKESAIFDNPNYSTNPVKKHINIYRSESSDSSFNSGQQTRQQWLEKTSKNSHAEGHKEQHHNSSQLSVFDSFEDECKLPVSPTGIPPASHYTHVDPNASKESAYAHPIKSTSDQYVSEHGHIYLMLEGGATAPDVGQERKVLPPPTYSKVIPKRERADSKLQLIEEANSLCVNAATYCSPPDTEDSSGSDYDVITREHSRATRHTSTSDDSGYDVIDRGEMKFPHRSFGVEAQYNVTDRQRHLSSPQDGDYDVIERTTTPSNNRTHKMAALNKNPRSPPAEYPCSPPAEYPCSPPAEYPRSPPAEYSSLELSGDREKKSTINANGPFYDALNLEKSSDKQETCQCKMSEAFYHILDPEERTSFAIP